MTWQLTLALCLYVGWIGLHAWLGKARHHAVLSVAIALELLAFAGSAIWVMLQNTSASTGGAAALAIFGMAAIFLVPAAVGVITFFKHRTIRL